MSYTDESDFDSGHTDDATGNTLNDEVDSQIGPAGVDAGVDAVDKPFRVNLAGNPLQKSIIWAARPAFERALRFATLNDLYAQTQAAGQDRHFADRALDALGVIVDVDEKQIERIPKTGPVVVIGNHPFGGLEGLILTAILNRVRDDVKLLANYMLSLIPDLRKDFFFVDPFGTPKSIQKNLTSIRSAIAWVAEGHMLGVFPAGEVSHLRLSQRRITDPPWSDTIARIVRRSNAVAVPVFFGGRNSALFQFMGMLHPRLRTVMLPREMLKKRDRQVPVIIGAPIGYPRLARFTDAKEMTAYLRLKTYFLQPKLNKRSWLLATRRTLSPAKPPQPIIDPIDPETLEAEVRNLPDRQKLVESGEYHVYFALSHQGADLLREIGRLRELSFRAVGEGTGKSIDLDDYDAYYLQLFIWHTQKRQIVGAYRMGQTDVIMTRYGITGLYTSTLFHFKQRLLDQISPALEIGRSFVHPDYQKSYAPLMLLWKGIGAYLAENPKYRYLFGPVSISATYSTMSKQLLIAFLQLNKSLPGMKRLLKARNPNRINPPRGWASRQYSTIVRDLNEVNQLISDLEADGKSMPVLLRQYLKLNGKLLGFNVDPEFDNALDGLMLFDITQLEPPIGAKYIGKESFKKFVEYHQQSS